MLNRRTYTGALLALLAVLLVSTTADAARRRRSARRPRSAPATQAVQQPQQTPRSEPEPRATATRDEPAPTSRGPARIDFDDRLIQGQTNKSGAVYLYDRKELSVRSMVDHRKSFRDQIIRDVLAE